MTMRYYFDLRDGDDITTDDEGMELPNLQRVQEEAARSLAGMARDAAATFDGSGEHERRPGPKNTALASRSP